ncbi:MAG: APC family permease [Actinomycetota bacterium]|nr:APC family permease [Actinomycetota bacterium]
MSTSSHEDAPHALPGDHQIRPQDSARLKVGAVGLVGVLFMAVANAAPITAMSLNVPIAIGYGNGIAVSGGYLFATIVLTIFTIGFVAMARYVTTAGAFYGFISQGLGQVWGMASGMLAAVAYVIFEASLIGGFAYFTTQYVLVPMGLTIHWLVVALIGIAIIAILSYFSVSLAASVLGVTLVAEVLILGTLGMSVLFKGGPDGYMASDTVNPVAAFTSLPEGAFGTGVAAGAAAIGIFFAFWSWVGYETTAVYGEESRNPKRNVPLATMIAVVGLGLFYTWMSWMVVVGNGAASSVEISAGASPIDLWLGLVNQNLGGFFENIYKLLVVVGSFACAMAFHNAASRYLYAMGRESITPSVRRSLGHVNEKHGSPAVASFVQSGITLLLMVLFLLFTNVYVPDANGTPVATPDLIPYVNVYGLLALIGTAMVLIVQTITCFAVIWFFWVKKVHKGNILTTFIAPIVGAAGMLYVLYLLWSNRNFAAGLAADSLVFQWMPYYVIGLFLIGVVYALYVRAKAPDIYAEIGRTTIEEAHERV